MTREFVLTCLEEGGRIEARRAFPAPHRYRLVGPDNYRYGDPLPVSWVVDLVEAGELEVASHSANYDQVDYRLKSLRSRTEVWPISLEGGTRP